MAIRRTDAPAGTWEAFEVGLRRLGIKPSSVPPPGGRALRYELAVITLDLAQVRAGGGLDQIQPRRTRCIDIGTKDRILAGDVKSADAGGPGGLAGYSADSQLDAELEALRGLERLDETAAGEYEPQLLRIPALLIEAFRLRPLAAGTALVVPFRAASAAIRRGRVYKEEEFFALLRPLVESFQQFETMEP